MKQRMSWAGALALAVAGGGAQAQGAPPYAGHQPGPYAGSSPGHHAGAPAGHYAGASSGQHAGPTPGQYGGGFIELLMTGRDPSPATRPVRAAPVAAGGYRASSPPGTPLYAAPEVRTASLPATAEVGIGRAPDPRYRRQVVDYDGPHAPGTIVIDTPSKHLYLVQAGGRAIRYGIGVGRPGFEWAGVKRVSMKREWPDWTPPPEMLKRRPDLPRHMAGGLDNPLGARALYLGSSLYRIHGTNEPNTIGQAVSSGCIRMLNDDVTDLYDRVRVGAKVIVI